MKINISFGERKLQIEINKYKIVKQIRCLIPDLWMENIGNEFQLIYKKIILNDEKMITFYNLNENDEIKIGKLEQFLNNDDVIVELFIAGWNATFIHLIVKKKYRISTIKLMISKIIPNVVNIWNVNGIEMRNNQFVNEIDLIGGYYKLIISDQQNGNHSFKECRKIQKNYLTSCYINISSSLAFLVDRNWLISRMNKLKEILSMNEIIAPNLNENLANIPFSFLNSELLFCTIISNRIWKICENYFNTMIYQFTNGLHSGITHLFMTSLQLTLINFIQNSKSSGKCVSQSLRSTVIEACEIFVESLENPDGFAMMLISIYFTESLSNDDDGDDNIELEQIILIFEFPRMTINSNDIQLFMPSSVKTILQLKETISMQTNIPVQHLQLIKDCEGRQTNDGEYFNRNTFYSVKVNENS